MLNECDARKLFNFIDYNETRVISKHQIRLLILYYKDFHGIGDPKLGQKQPNEMIKRLMKMLLVPDLKVFDENLFSFFFTNKNPNKALKPASIAPKVKTEFPSVTKPEIPSGGDNFSFLANKRAHNRPEQGNDFLNINPWNTKSSANPWST